MQYFTHEDLNPSERTLNIIRQVAYSYRVLKMNGSIQQYCLN